MKGGAAIVLVSIMAIAACRLDEDCRRVRIDVTFTRGEEVVRGYMETKCETYLDRGISGTFSSLSGGGGWVGDDVFPNRRIIVTGTAFQQICKGALKPFHPVHPVTLELDYDARTVNGEKESWVGAIALLDDDGEVVWETRDVVNVINGVRREFKDQRYIVQAPKEGVVITMRLDTDSIVKAPCTPPQRAVDSPTFIRN